jgi:CAAX prenyl protease-like protein
LNDLVPWPSVGALSLSFALGLAVTAIWVGLDGRYPEIPQLGKRVGFDPLLMPKFERVMFLCLRMIGLVGLVPLIEEIFYRAFLMRWIVDPDFKKVQLGKVTPAGVAATTTVFAFSHPEWLPALLTGLAWSWLLWRTKSVSACVVSHAVANLALGVYVLATHEWKYW